MAKQVTTAHKSFLIQYMKEDIDAVLRYASDFILDNILKPNIQTFVYDVYEPQIYNRDHEGGNFIGSWVLDEYDSGMKKGGVMSYLIYSEPDLMALIPGESVHSSPWRRFRKKDDDGQLELWSWEPSMDRRDMMAEIVAEGTHWDWGKGAAMQRDYMAPTLEDVSESFERIIQSGFETQGVSGFFN